MKRRRDQENEGDRMRGRKVMKMERRGSQIAEQKKGVRKGERIVFPLPWYTEQGGKTRTNNKDNRRIGPECSHPSKGEQSRIERRESNN